MSQSATATVLGFEPVLAILIIALTFPDTHGRELEEITGEEVGPAVAVAAHA